MKSKKQLNRERVGRKTHCIHYHNLRKSLPLRRFAYSPDISAKYCAYYLHDGRSSATIMDEWSKARKTLGAC